MSLAYRPAIERDLKFVLYSWVKSQKFEPTAGLIAVKDWREIMTPQLASILDRPEVEIFVAYKPEETDHTADLFGWIAVERGHKAPLVHYIFVKKHFRYEGIGRGLFAAAGVDPSKWFFYSCQSLLVGRRDREGRIPLLRRFHLAEFAPRFARQPRDQNRKAQRDHGQRQKEAGVPR